MGKEIKASEEAFNEEDVKEIACSCMDVPENKCTKIPSFVKTGTYIKGLKVEEIWTLYGLFPVGISLLVGASDTGKSMALRQLAICVAGRMKFLGREWNGKTGKVIVAITEDDETATSFFLNRQNIDIEAPDEAFENIRFIFDTENIIEKLTSEMQRDPADIIILDALGDLFNGKDLNANNQVRSFLQQFSNLANRFSCPVVFLHHTSKRSEDLAPSKNNSIGSQGIEAKCRLVMELRLSAQGPDIRHLCIVKGNYISQRDKSASIDLVMSENFVFTDTGKRTDFEDLVAKNGKRKAPEYIDDAEHIAFIKATFRSKNDVYTGRDFTALVARHFEVSDKTARMYQAMYLAKGWIKDKSRSKSRSELTINELTGKLQI